jgi:hypothetical protein
MIRLRGHHLICLHFFSGEGYDNIFIDNLRNVMERTETEEIEVCEEADEICEKCPYLKDNQCRYDEHSDEEIKKMDKAAVSLLEIDKGIKVGWHKIKRNIPEIFFQWYMDNCNKCDWKQVCEKNHLYQNLKN